jgi:tRNA(Ile)-lysidine synthase
MIDAGQGHAALELLKDVEMHREGERITFSFRAPDSVKKETGPYALSVPGEARLPDGSCIMAREARSLPEVSDRLQVQNPLLEVADLDLCGHSLAVRTRRPGDRFFPLGAPGKRKLKDYLIDQKIPRMLRDGLALVCREDQVIWVAGLRLGHRFRVTPSTRRFLILEIKKKRSPL